MLVPEAAVHLDDLPTGREDQVGRAGKIPPVQSITIPQAIRDAPYREFRLGVRLPYATHVRASGLWRQRIHWLL
jgi:hypothetical protein